MNLYEWEGKKIFTTYGILVPKGVVVRREDNFALKYKSLNCIEVVVKGQILSGKRGKNQGVIFCSSEEEVEKACAELFSKFICKQYVSSVLIEERIVIAEEHYISIGYDMHNQTPLLTYCTKGGMDIEEIPVEFFKKQLLDVRFDKLSSSFVYAQNMWDCFLREDARLIEINPLVKTCNGQWVAVDAKIALDDDAFFRHKKWETLETRTNLGRIPTERELAVKKIDEGENYYRGTASKYIELEGNVAVLFSGGGASVSNMDALIKAGCKPANYTEYSGNPPREKVYQLAKIVLSKPNLKGLWIAGAVANFTNIAETFQGIIDVLDEIKPTYPIVVRRAGPYEKVGLKLMNECKERNHLNMKIFTKETSMSDTAKILADMI